MRKRHPFFVSLVLTCVSKIFKIKNEGKEKSFSLRTCVCISSWEAHTQPGEESTSHECAFQIFKRHWGKASLRRSEMTHYYRQRGPVPGLTINTQGRVSSQSRILKVSKFPL